MALVVADGMANRAAHAAHAPLPAAPRFDVAAVTAVRFDHGDTERRWHRGAQGWTVGAQGSVSDHSGIERLVQRLSAGVAPYSRADEGNLKQYGMTNAEDIRVTVLADDLPLTSLVVGRDAPGGGSFVRWANDQTVYRADIGGRAGVAALAHSQ